MMSDETLQYCIDREKEYIRRIAELENQLGNARAELQNAKEWILHLEAKERIRTAQEAEK
jgi:glutamine synthetase type III